MASGAERTAETLMGAYSDARREIPEAFPEIPDEPVRAGLRDTEIDKLLDRRAREILKEQAKPLTEKNYADALSQAKKEYANPRLRSDLFPHAHEVSEPKAA